MVFQVTTLLFLQTLEVATGTKVRDLIKSISKKLNLISADGYSLFVKAQDKVCFSFSNLLTSFLAF